MGERESLFASLRRRVAAGRIGVWRGFYLCIGKSMLSCHLNGYGDGKSQFAVNFGGQRTGSVWHGWWSDTGWASKRQKPLKVNGVEIPEDGTSVVDSNGAQCIAVI